jgi:hypothetical protein
MPIGINIGLFVGMMLAFIMRIMHAVIVDITCGSDARVAEHATLALAARARLSCVRCMRPVTLVPKTWAHPVSIQGTIMVTT